MESKEISQTLNVYFEVFCHNHVLEALCVCVLLLHMLYSLLNAGIMCARVHSKFAGEIMAEPENGGKRGYELIPQHQRAH